MNRKKSFNIRNNSIRKKQFGDFELINKNNLGEYLDNWETKLKWNKNWKQKKKLSFINNKIKITESELSSNFGICKDIIKFENLNYKLNSDNNKTKIIKNNYNKFKIKNFYNFSKYWNTKLIENIVLTKSKTKLDYENINDFNEIENLKKSLLNYKEYLSQVNVLNNKTIKEIYPIFKYVKNYIDKKIIKNFKNLNSLFHPGTNINLNKIIDKIFMELSYKYEKKNLKNQENYINEKYNSKIKKENLKIIKYFEKEYKLINSKFILSDKNLKYFYKRIHFNSIKLQILNKKAKVIHKKLNEIYIENLNINMDKLYKDKNIIIEDIFLCKEKLSNLNSKLKYEKFNKEKLNTQLEFQKILITGFCYFFMNNKKFLENYGILLYLLKIKKYKKIIEIEKILLVNFNEELLSYINEIIYLIIKFKLISKLQKKLKIRNEKKINLKKLINKNTDLNEIKKSIYQPLITKEKSSVVDKNDILYKLKINYQIKEKNNDINNKSCYNNKNNLSLMNISKRKLDRIRYFKKRFTNLSKIDKNSNKKRFKNNIINNLKHIYNGILINFKSSINKNFYNLLNLILKDNKINSKSKYLLFILFGKEAKNEILKSFNLYKQIKYDNIFRFKFISNYINFNKYN